MLYRVLTLDPAFFSFLINWSDLAQYYYQYQIYQIKALDV